MTNTKFRKRMLLSSVAMLLVALVALGSATFAWFSTRTNATAYGFTAATTKASNLSIKETSSDPWASDIEFKVATADPANSLTPITTSNGTAWKIATAAGQDLGYAENAAALTDQAVNTTYMAYSTLYVKYGETATPAAADKDLTVTVNAKTGADTTRLDYVRVALVPVAEGNDASALGSSAVIFGNAKDDFAKNPTDWVKPASGSSAPTPSATTSAVTNLFGNTAVNLGNMTNGTIYKYNVYVYFEGTDVHCKDSNAGGSLDDFQFEFNVANHGS